MISETSPTAIYESFMRPVMSNEYVTKLIRQVWTAAYSKGVADTDRSHSILDEPEFKITELLRFPVKVESERRQTTRKSNLDNLELPDLAKVVQLYQPKVCTRKKAENSK